MDLFGFKELVQSIVSNARDLKDKYTDQKDAPVNYACIYTHSDNEYEELTKLIENIGTKVHETSSGFVYQIEPLETVSGPLKLLKIRIPAPERKEIGDADFTVDDYQSFKAKYLNKEGFSLKKKSENFEMIEIADPEFDVKVYFSNPPLDKKLGIE